MREFEYIEGVGMTINNEAIQNKMKRCVDHMMKEHNRLEDEATINALRSYGYEVIKWHPYPEETPPEYGEYMVTASDDMMERTRFIDLWHYCKNDEFQKVGYMLPPETHVIAWAEKPKPYFGSEQTEES